MTCMSFLHISSISGCPDVAMLTFGAEVMRLADVTYRGVRPLHVELARNLTDDLLFPISPDYEATSNFMFMVPCIADLY